MYIIRETTERESDGLELSSHETVIAGTDNDALSEYIIDDVFAMYAADLANDYRKEALAIGYMNMKKRYCVYLLVVDENDDYEVIDFAKYDSHDFMEGLQ